MPARQPREEADNLAFIVSHGSFNPVHAHHIEMMVRAKQCLENLGYHVVRGVMGITCHSYLAQKLPGEAISEELRVEVLRRCCGGTLEWLSPEPRGAQFTSVSRLIAGLRPELVREAPGATIFSVVGADVLARYQSERCIKQPTVLLCRAGDVELARRVAQLSPNVHLLEELAGELSSTRVRAALRSGDDEAVRSMCPAPAAEFLLDLGAEALFARRAARNRSSHETRGPLTRAAVSARDAEEDGKTAVAALVEPDQDRKKRWARRDRARKA